MVDLQTQSSLGKSVTYHTEAPQASLLVSLPREDKRTEMGISTSTLPFKGVDIWNAYEFSWLRPSGRPDVAVLTVSVPAHSPCLIESKSFKLYLNSFNQSRLETAAVLDMLERDLSACAQAPISVVLQKPRSLDNKALQTPTGVDLDQLDPQGPYVYTPAPELLNTRDNHVEETLVSSLLKSNCLITNQPDWADIQISYHGPQIDHESLLRYIISFRMQNEFHEPCVEKIFHDIQTHCKPSKLTVKAQYTRRGGLDINPIRSTEVVDSHIFLRTPRQ